MNLSIRQNLLALALATSMLASGAALATRIMYLEQTIEMTRMVQVTPMDGSGAGTLTLTHDCEKCPDSLPYNRETRLTTPFGPDRPISELVQWQGHPATINYALPEPVATEILVRSIGADTTESF